MKYKYPETILILHDDYHAEHIGITKDQKQFFLTTPFVPTTGDEVGCEFIALYYFDMKGKLLEAKIENLGPRKNLDENKAKAIYQNYLDELAGANFCDINISAFKIVKYDTEFGLIPIDDEFVEDENDISLEIQPGNYMAFYPPWDGEYDT